MNNSKKIGLTNTLRSKSKPKKDMKEIDKIVSAVHNERIKRLIIEMPESMHIKIKTIAAKKGETMKNFVTELLEDAINNS